MEIVAIVSRLVHVGTAITLVGGSAFMLLVLMPAAKALSNYSQLGAREIAEESLKIASEICIYTNDKITVEELQSNEQ